MLPNFTPLSKTEKGLNVIKKLIIELRWQKPQLMLVAQVLAHANNVIEDRYSNYVLQVMVQTWNNEVTVSLFGLILGKIKYYSLQKSSSPVVEAMFINCNTKMRDLYLKELIEMPDLHNKLVIQLWWKVVMGITFCKKF